MFWSIPSLLLLFYQFVCMRLITGMMIGSGHSNWNALERETGRGNVPSVQRDSRPTWVPSCAAQAVCSQSYFPNWTTWSFTAIRNTELHSVTALDVIEGTMEIIT